MRNLLLLLLLLPLSCQAQTIEQVERELTKQGVPHAQIVLAQARLESGNMKSEFYKRTNNLFGIKHRGRYATYKHWRESIKDYKERISSRYEGKENYYHFLKRIGYAEDNKYLNKVKEIVKSKPK